MLSLHLILLLLAGLVLSEDPTGSVEPTAPLGPYYPEDGQYYPDYGYPATQDTAPSIIDRQAIETVLGAPVVITAFFAALVGGIMSPFISEGLSRLGEYEIEWPEVKRRVPLPSSEDSEEEDGRSLDSWSWIKALETVSQAVEASRTKRSSQMFSKFLKR